MDPFATMGSRPFAGATRAERRRAATGKKAGIALERAAQALNDYITACRACGETLNLYDDPNAWLSVSDAEAQRPADRQLEISGADLDPAPRRCSPSDSLRYRSNPVHESTHQRGRLVARLHSKVVFECLFANPANLCLSVDLDRELNKVVFVGPPGVVAHGSLSFWTKV